LRSTEELIPDEVLYPYPDPDVVGLRMDPKEMAKIAQVTAGSSADHDGFRAGDEIVSLDGQPLLSIADIQWVVHNAPATATLPVRVRREGTIVDATMTLKAGWRRGNISWRPTTWELRRLGFGGMKLEAITDVEYRQLGLAQEQMALRAIHVGEYGDHAIAKRAGLQKGDVIVSFDGKDRRMTESELLAYTLQQKRPGDRVDVVIARDGTRKDLSFMLPK
jgi:S1-C subfamily serine protease